MAICQRSTHGHIHRNVHKRLKTPNNGAYKCQVQRVEARQPGEEMKGVRDSLYEMYKAYEPAGEDEPNSFNVQIDENMTVKVSFNFMTQTKIPP